MEVMYSPVFTQTSSVGGCRSLAAVTSKENLQQGGLLVGFWSREG